MTSSTTGMKRYTTTEEGGRQNMFAAEPQIEVLEVDYWTNAEQTNGRLARLGFFALVHNYILFGAVIPGIFEEIKSKVSYTTCNSRSLSIPNTIKRKEFKTMTPEAEKFNGWMAMIGFVAATGAYITTGQIIPGIF